MVKKGAGASCIIALALGILLNAPLGLAEEPEPKLYFSEIAWAGSSYSSADEFIELYNCSDQAIDLKGYSVWDEAWINPDTKLNVSKMMINIEDGQIAPGGHFLISNYQSNMDKTILNTESDLVDTSISLSNEHFKLSLRDYFGNIVDLAGDGLKPFYYAEVTSLADQNGSKFKSSIERISWSDGANLSSWSMTKDSNNIKPGMDLMNPEASGRLKLLAFDLPDSSYVLNSETTKAFSYKTDKEVTKVEVKYNLGERTETLTLEPGAKSLTLPKSNTCYTLKFIFYGSSGLSRAKELGLKCYEKNYQLKFSEVLTSPKNHDWNLDGKFTSDDEWIELFNESHKDYSLDGWKIKDESGKIFNLSGSIKSFGYLVLYSDVTNFSFNNSGEVICLIDPSGEVIDYISIPALPYDIAYAKLGSWQKTNRPSPGQANLANQDDLAKIKQEAPIEEGLIDEQEPVDSGIKQVMPGEQIKQTVVIETVSYLDNDELFSDIEGEYAPMLDGSMVLSGQAYKLSDPFILLPYLIYLLLALFIFVSVNLVYYGFYRRE